MSKANINAQIDTIKEMLEEFREKTNKCENKNILSFAKTIGENFQYLREQIIRSGSTQVIEKTLFGQEVERLENDFGNINDDFNNRCKCSK